MSSENLNINPVNPLEEKSDDIKFTTDLLGIKRPSTIIPTDVEYFVKKQKGELESKFTGLEAIKKSFQIDNLGVSLFNKFTKSDGYQIDLDFEPTREMVESISKYPEYIRDAFYDAKSEEHFFDIEKQVKERLEIEEEIAKLGWRGFGARAIAAVADPVAVGLSIATLPFGGYGAYATLPTKIDRLKRAIKFGAIVGGENAAIETGLVALDPYKNPNDIAYALLGGFTLGSPAGWIGRVDASVNKVPKDIVDSYKKLDTAANNRRQQIDLEDTIKFANETGSELNPDYIKNKSLKLTKETNTMNFKVINDPSNSPDKGTFWEEIFKGFIARFDLAGQLNRSEVSLVKRFREVAVPDGVVGNPKGDTAIEWKQRTTYKIMSPFMYYRDVALRSFKNANKDLSFKNTFDLEERFEAIMTDLVEFPNKLKFSNQVTDEMKQFARLAKKVYDDTLDIVGQTGREGWQDVAKFRQNNYVPHVHKPAKVIEAISRYGEKQVREVYANALRDMKADLGKKTFDKMIKKIVKKISSPRTLGQEADISRIFQGSNTDVIREFLEELELTKEQIEQILAKVQKGSGNTLDRNANRRLPFDLNARLDLKNIKTGELESLSLKDLTDRNLTRITRMYNSQVIGNAAMARFFNFKNNKEYRKFLKKVESEGVTYKNIDRDIENIEVIAASLTGRQSPLEKGGDPNSFMRRTARLVQDYNFLRLFGQVGFAQGAELYQGISEVGLKTFLKSNPAFKDVISRLKAGDIKFDDPLLEELRVEGLPMGIDKFMHAPTGRFDNELDIPLSGTGGRLDNTELLAGKGKRFVADVSFLNPLTLYTQIAVGRGMSFKISDIVNDYIKRTGTTKIYSKLSKGDQVRFKTLGWNETEFDGIAVQIKKHSVYENGKFQSLGLEDWTPQARSDFNVGMQRFIDRVVQRNDVGALNRFFTTDYTRILTQFRTFTLGSYTKQLMNRLYVLAETRGKDFHTYSTFMASMVGAAQFYAVQTYINSFGRDDREEYLEKRLSVENLARVGFMRSSWSSLIPGAVDTAMMPFTENQLFGYGRNTELTSNFLSGIPSINLLNTVLDTTQTATKLVFNEDYQASKRDVQKFLSLIILQNALIVKNINNMIVDELGE
nr:putative internal virion protein [uncultured Mediterranean phage uvMED]